jgi:ammonia channel protein AmtB
VDSFGSYFIFTYGGFMGLSLGLILKTKEDKTEKSTTQRHRLNTPSVLSVIRSMFGTLIIFAIFPVLAYETDSFNPFNIFNQYNSPLSVVIGMGSSLIGAYIISSLINGNPIVIDLIHGPIAGGIVVGAASYFITSPLYAIIAGFTAGLIQSLIQNVFESRYAKNKSVVSTISWSLFGIQGIIGGVFATGYRHILKYNSNHFIYDSTSLNSP